MRKYREADPIRGLQYFIADFPIDNLNLTNDATAMNFVNSLEGLSQWDEGDVVEESEFDFLEDI